MSAKVRHIDFYPDEYIAGVGGRLSAVDQGVYWMICSLVYSRGGPIDDDHVWLSHLFVDTHWRTVRAAIDRLIKLGKVSRSEGGVITVTRCARELQKALTRSSQASQNGGKGGRTAKENNNIPEPEASQDKKLTTNHQPPTIKKESSLRDDATTPLGELSNVLDKQHAKDVVEHRQRLRKPLTVSAAKKLAAKLAKWPDPNEAADAMLSNGWLGFEAAWLEGRATGPPRQSSGKVNKSPAAILRELIEKEASDGQGNRTDLAGGPVIDHTPPDGTSGPGGAQKGDRPPARRV